MCVCVYAWVRVCMCVRAWVRGCAPHLANISKMAQDATRAGAKERKRPERPPPKEISQKAKKILVIKKKPLPLHLENQNTKQYGTVNT